MSLGIDLGIYDAVIILGASFPAIYVASRISNPKLRALSLLLGTFLALHGLFHLTAVLGAVYDYDPLEFASLGLVQPLSYLVLLIFAFRLFRLGAPAD